MSCCGHLHIPPPVKFKGMSVLPGVVVFHSHLGNNTTCWLQVGKLIYVIEEIQQFTFCFENKFICMDL